MSLELFHKVPAGAIETLFDEQNQSLSKRADLENYLVIENIKDNFKDFPSHYTQPRLNLEGEVLNSPRWRAKNPHDIFINLDGSIEMAVRSKKPKAVALVKWLTKKVVEKIQEEHQQAIMAMKIKYKPLSLQMKNINRKFQSSTRRLMTL